MALKGSHTVTENDPPTEEIKVPDRALRSKDPPIKKEPDAEPVLGKRSEPEPVEDPDAADWIELRRLAQTNKRAKLLEQSSAVALKELARRMKLRFEPGFPDEE